MFVINFNEEEESSMCTTEKLRLLLDDNVREIRKILVENGYYLDPLVLAQLDVKEPLIKKMENIRRW